MAGAVTLRWSELAEWRGPTPAHGGAMIEQRGMVVHIAEGSYEGTISWQKGPNNVSSHFVVAGPNDTHDGQIAQVVDLDVIAWTQIDGNGHWLSSENSGFSTGSGLSQAQLEANAQLYARGMRELGWPAQLATSPVDRGLAYHGIACAGPGGDPRAPWTVQNTSGQTWGHCDCPGTAVISQLPLILARAVAINGGGGDIMRYWFDSSYADRPAELGTRTVRTDGMGMYSVETASTSEVGVPPKVQVHKGSSGSKTIADQPADWSFGKSFQALTGCAWDGMDGGLAPFRQPAAAVATDHEHTTPAGVTGPAQPTG